MHFPEPALVMWIIGAPFVLAIIDLMRTVSALKNSPSGQPGAYSQALHIDQARVAQAVR